MFSVVVNSGQNYTKSTDSIQLGHKQDKRMDMQENNFSSNKVTHQSVGAEIKLATEPSLRQFEKLWALLAERN